MHPTVTSGGDLGRAYDGKLGVDPTFAPITPPPRPRPMLPNPGVTENGKVFCNEPLVDHDGLSTGYYCGRLVKQHHRGREQGTHRGAHRVEWWS